VALGTRLLKTWLFATLLFAGYASAAPAVLACRIAVLGDSLTAGYGVELSEAFPSRLEEALRSAGFACEVLNAGVSGDTSAGGLARLDWVLADRPTHLIVELGGNDALRGLPPEQLEHNLDAILRKAEEAGAHAFVAGMRAPRNLGETYAQAFDEAYERVAESHGVPLYPFFLDGVVFDRSLMQPDGIHPTAQGVREIVERVLPAITRWLEQTGLESGSRSSTLGVRPNDSRSEKRLVVGMQELTHKLLTAMGTTRGLRSKMWKTCG
jgi:acyl-CoA thioesterase-1